jgi:hypothetical protein
LRVLWQEMSAVRAGHCVARARFGPSRRCVRVLYLHFKCCRAFAAANANSLKVHKPRGIRQANTIQKKTTTDDADYTNEMAGQAFRLHEHFASDATIFCMQDCGVRRCISSVNYPCHPRYPWFIML